MTETFITKRFGKKAKQIIETANAILDEYSAKGFDLSLRQLYYQFVARAIIPNSERMYKMIGNIISDGRLAGMIDWGMIQDRGRGTIQNSHWESPADILRAAAKQFMFDRWSDQQYHVEVMVEKQALEGVLIPVCRGLDVPFSANKGYSSSSAMYGTGKRIENKIGEGKQIVILYLGDHDPSGIDMTRDVEERLNMFSNSYGPKPQVRVERIALNIEQIKTLNPPENPAKMTDSRANAYVERFGKSSWELDAIEPNALAELVKKGIMKYIEAEKWAAMERREEQVKKKIEGLGKIFEGKKKRRAK